MNEQLVGISPRLYELIIVHMIFHKFHLFLLSSSEPLRETKHPLTWNPLSVHFTIRD